MSEREELAELDTRVAVLERDVGQFNGFFHRLDATIEKLTEVSSSIKEMLAVHEVRIRQTDDRSIIISNSLEEHKKAVADMGKSLESSIEEMEDRLLREITAAKKTGDDANRGVEKTRIIMMSMGVLIAFILWKIGVVPTFLMHF